MVLSTITAETPHPENYVRRWSLSIPRTLAWLPLLLVLGGSGCLAAGPAHPTTVPLGAANPLPSGTTIAVVAAENFYGDIAQQLGSGHVSVVSILSDPNIDPHEYESSVLNGVQVSRAQLVILNGSGYDTWMDKLLAASPNPARTVVVAADVSSHKLPYNPHFWYSLDDIQEIARSITGALDRMDPGHRSDYDSAGTSFDVSLEPIRREIDDLKSDYAGTPVGLTETVFLYQSEAIGLNVLTPFDFQKAIAEGNDPPADAVLTTNDQISGRQIRLLIYNVQTVTPLTTNLTQAARQLQIPIVPVTETMPSGKRYQSWMLDQLAALQRALGG
jgi:zinc/manganese transport system substrate-binding protein